jgi:hypothetical protein
MSLEKITKIDKIEIVGDHKLLQVREVTVIKENGVELSSSYHRCSFTPSDDVSSQPDEIKNIANLLWTDEIKAAYQASLENPIV